MSAPLFLIQRLTALILAPLVLVHLGVIVYAVRNGVSAVEMLDRTRDSLAWALFYGGFAAIAAAHGAIGLRAILTEWGRLSPRTANGIAWAAGLTLLFAGLRAVAAVTGAGAP